ncbi:MAG TPA: GNAT family N-acetyltransferase [Thermoleophilia bacterium]|nr:GNAT family N-acetyltransferase [Thermoleophilia bacterium]
MADSHWQARYEAKRTTVRDALSNIRRGDRIFIGAGCGEPQSLVRGLAEMGSKLVDSEVYHLLTLGTAPYTAPRFSDTFRHNSFFIGHDVRSDVAEGRADYTPVFLSEVPALFTDGHIPVDVALIQVSPPDAHGTCSYGVAVDITKPAAESARIRIAQVNRLMPRTLGDSFIHVDDLNVVVELDEPILTVPLHETTEVSREIGRQVAKLVDDGCCLQVGIGSVTGAMLDHLHNRRDLGLHTEMFTDAVIDLISEGVINNSLKTLHRGKILASFCMGTHRLYEFVHDNPMCEFRPSSYTNDPYIIGQNDKMVAVNAALEIDLTGQVCSDSLGYDFYSGIGGQVDFMRGAARSRGGKPVICLPSEAAEGRSRIVPHLSEGAGVVTTRGGVHYVVTEHGIAYLHGKSIRERAMALIQIAHPDHRAELLAHAKERRYIFMDQESPRSDRYPDELERYVTLDDGGTVLFRPLRPTDDALVRDLFYDTSEDAVYKRFMNAKATYPRDERDAIVNIDYRTTMSLAAARSGPGAAELVALAEWRLSPDDDYAEVAFMVRDDWQHRGLGMRLLQYLIELGTERGLAGFRAEVLPDNQGMLHVFQQCAREVKIKLVDGAYEVLIDFATADARTPPGTSAPPPEAAE